MILIRSARQFLLLSAAAQLVLILTLQIFVPEFVQAEAADSAPQAAAQKSYSREVLHRLKEGVVKFKLSNGLRVIMYRRTQAPVFSGVIWVRVGSVNETPGVTGVSHMLEHMAFKGTQVIGTKDYDKEKVLLDRLEVLLDQTQDGTIAPTEAQAKEFAEIKQQLEQLWENNEFARIYQERGATDLNAATSKDYTNYQVSLPNVGFELWCWVESDRLLAPVFRQFYKERSVVGEERHSSVDDNPQGKLYEAVLHTAFETHPNRYPTIGWESDIKGLRRADIEKLYEAYYRPDNMVLALVGDLDPAQARPMLERYFGRVPAKSGTVPPVRVVERPQEGERTAVVKFDAEPQFMMAFHKPVFPSNDDLHFAPLHSVLSQGRSSLLHRELVQRKQIATGLYSTEAPGERFPNLFLLGGSPRRGTTNEQVIAEVQAILDRVKTQGVAPEDLEAAKKRMKVDMINVLDGNLGLAERLGHAELIWDDWEKLFDVYDGMFATTNEDIKRVAQKYLTIENRTIVKLVRQ